MILTLFLVTVLIFTLVPLVMTLWNQSLLVDITIAGDPTDGIEANGSGTSGEVPSVSVLIPARNEEKRIGEALGSLVGQGSRLLEVIVLDDHSTDETVRVVESWRDKIPGLRVIPGKDLPPGWCGKNFALQQLADDASGDLLLFVDADVRLQPGAVEAICGFMQRHPGVMLSSGIPRQILGTFWERLLIPQIHFILMAYLPMASMRRTLDPGFAAACGQLLVVRKQAYRESNGHAAIANRIHDGLQLARDFRRKGFATDLFDATGLAVCRMYDNGPDVFHGLAKNATEGMADWKAIFPMSALLLFGQILPVIILIAMMLLPDVRGLDLTLASAAAIISLLPRLIICRRFRLGCAFAFLQPVAALVLLAIQWHARINASRGIPAVWRGRQYAPR